MRYVLSRSLKKSSPGGGDFFPSKAGDTSTRDHGARLHWIKADLRGSTYRAPYVGGNTS